MHVLFFCPRGILNKFVDVHNGNSTQIAMENIKTANLMEVFSSQNHLVFQSSTKNKRTYSSILLQKPVCDMNEIRLTVKQADIQKFNNESKFLFQW